MTTPSPTRWSPAAERARHRVGVVVGALAVGGAAAYLYAVSPEQPGRYLPCPSLALTGTWCPGCGGLRSLHALMHGDVGLSLARHPLVLPLLVVLAVWAVRWWSRGRPPLRVDPSGWRFRVTLVAVALFWVARNVPGWDWLSPV